MATMDQIKIEIVDDLKKAGWPEDDAKEVADAVSFGVDKMWRGLGKTIDRLESEEKKMQAAMFVMALIGERCQRHLAQIKHFNSGETIQ